MLGYHPLSDQPISALATAGAGVTGTLATTNANDTLAAAGSPVIVGTLARTNANDTSIASGSPIIVGTSSTTNANDTLAASGSSGLSVTGTVAYTNNNDTATASGWAGAISGTLATTNADDTLSASGTASGGNQDGAGGRFQYPNWQPYIIAKRDWEKKIPPVVVQTIERIARKDTTEADALRLLEAELDAAQYQARYAQMLRALMRSQFQSLQTLRREQLADFERMERDEEDSIMLLM